MNEYRVGRWGDSICLDSGVHKDQIHELVFESHAYLSEQPDCLASPDSMAGGAVFSGVLQSPAIKSIWFLGTCLMASWRDFQTKVRSLRRT